VTLLRALSIPFHPTSAIFIALLSILVAVAIRYDITGILWILPAFIATSWAFKYAFAMLESIADGEIEAPVASYEMLSVFEQRPFVLLLIVIGIGQFTWWIDGTKGYVLVALLIALIPASIGILGATQRVILSVNPLVLLQTVRGMGWWYVLLLTVVAALGGLSVWLVQSGVWLVVSVWQIGMSVLVVFSLIGGVMFERRIEIGHEPRISPEKVALVERREHERLLKRALDEIYNAVRLGDLVRAMRDLDQWLSSVDDEFVASDCDHIHTTIMGWNDAEMLTAASRAIALTLVQVEHPDLLTVVVAATLKSLPAFTLKTEQSLLTVVHLLQSRGRRDLALPLVVNFVNNNSNQISSGISALRQRLEQAKS
jgi:hypothetical protein